MTRDVASRFHTQLGETFVLPEAQVKEETMYVPGTDGQKMSKSKGNLIDIFQPDKKLRKQIMGIVTDSKPLEAPKDPDHDNVFALYKLLATEEEVSRMRDNYLGGNYGYGHAKQALYEVIIREFADARSRFTHYMENLEEVDAILAQGAAKAARVGDAVLRRVREQLGYQ